MFLYHKLPFDLQRWYFTGVAYDHDLRMPPIEEFGVNGQKVNAKLWKSEFVAMGVCVPLREVLLLDFQYNTVKGQMVAVVLTLLCSEIFPLKFKSSQPLCMFTRVCLSYLQCKNLS